MREVFFDILRTEVKPIRYSSAWETHVNRDVGHGEQRRKRVKELAECCPFPLLAKESKVLGVFRGFARDCGGKRYSSTTRHGFPCKQTAVLARVDAAIGDL
jgi:hypothetical protein